MTSIHEAHVDGHLDAAAVAQPSSLPSDVDGRDLRGLTIRTIYEDHARFVWLSLQRLGVRPADLDDLAHEVFVVAHRRLDSFSGSGRMTTWLFGICMRIAANYRRRRRYSSEIQTGVNGENRPAAAVPVDELLVLRERRLLAEKVLGQLVLGQRAVFVMYEIEALPCPEIAELLGLPIGTVYSRLYAARKRIEKLVSLMLAGTTNGVGPQETRGVANQFSWNRDHARSPSTERRQSEGR
jgi:RNA polymerase sigma-70 factor (ECF subfamily)